MDHVRQITLNQTL